MRVLVCGSRWWNDPEPIRMFLSGLATENPQASITVIHGGLEGADVYAEAAAGYLGMSAERHEEMTLEGVDLVLLFMDEAIADKRCAEVRDRARALDLPVYVIRHDTD